MHSIKLRRLSLIPIVGLLLSGMLACDFGGGAGAAKPRVTCSSPVSGMELEVGQQVEIVCMVEDPKGVVSVELAVDGVPYATQESPNPLGQPQWKFVESWTAKVDPGIHTLTITAYNVDNVASDPVSISVTVLEGPVPGATGAVTLPTDTAATPGTTATGPSLGATEAASAPAPTPTTGVPMPTRTTAAAPPPTNTPVPPGPTNTPVPPPPTNTPVPPPTSTPMPGLPDLIIYAIYLSRDTVPYGETVHATVMVVNQGNAPAGPFRVSWEFGSGSGGKDVPGLAPNQSYPLEWDSLPLYESYDTRAMADESQVVQESNEGNNTLLRRVNVTAPPALPDLIIREISLDPPWPGRGDVGQATIHVANHGLGDAETPFYVHYWFQEGQRCTFSIDALDAGAEYDVRCSVGPFWNTYHTYAYADVDDTVAESNEDNNRLDLYVEIF